MRKITLEPQATYKNHPVITGDIKKYQFNPCHLDNNLKLLDSYIQRHNKVYSWRMDLRLPDGEAKENPRLCRHEIFAQTARQRICTAAKNEAVLFA